MSIEALNQIWNELQRACIAGSNNVLDNESLKRLFPVLKISGEAAPVFNKILTLLEKAVADGSPSSLLDAAHLVSSVLTTQSCFSASIQSTDHAQPCQVDYPHSKQLSYRELTALNTALTSQGTTRLDILNDAAKNGMLTDLRLASNLIKTLSDTNSDIVALASDALVRLGSQVVPILLRRFSASSPEQCNFRLLTVISSIQKEKSLELYSRCAIKGCKEIRAAAIPLLCAYGNSSKEREIIANAVNDKAREVRSAALYALAQLGDEAAVTAIKEAVFGKSFDIALKALMSSESVLVEDTVIELLDAFSDWTSPNNYGKFEYLVSVLNIHKGFTVKLFNKLTDQCMSLSGTWANSQPYLRTMMYSSIASFGTQEALSFLQARPDADISIVASLALEISDPHSFYDKYSALTDPSDIFAFREILKNALMRTDDNTVDPRWNEFYLSKSDGLMIALTSRHGMKKSANYLQRFEVDYSAKNTSETFLLVFGVYPQALIRMGIIDFWDSMLDSFEQAVLAVSDSKSFPWWRLTSSGLVNILALEGAKVISRITSLTKRLPENRDLPELIDAICTVMQAGPYGEDNII